jgi:hypothetical protein
VAKIQDTRIVIKDPATDERLELKCVTSVDDAGVFQVRVPEELLEVVRATRFDGKTVASVSVRGHTHLRGPVLATLREALQQAYLQVLAPEVTVERVILYHLGSHVSFAETPDGTIVPNASWPDASWASNAWYGEHHSAKPSQGGYSLVIGARVVDKTTLKRGNTVTVKYERVGAEGERTDPLYLLQSWAAFSLPDEDECSEMPYTPEAALFFHRLLLGMAELSRRIQEFAHDEQRMLAAIANGSAMLLPAPPAA